jgi:hypothetical protein
VIESVPAGSAVDVKTAIPLAFRVAVPRISPPFRNATVPVGTVLPVFGVTVAVKVTLCPVLIAVAEAVSELVVAISVCVTVTVTGPEVEAELLVLAP